MRKEETPLPGVQASLQLTFKEIGGHPNAS